MSPSIRLLIKRTFSVIGHSQLIKKKLISFKWSPHLIHSVIYEMSSVLIPSHCIIEGVEGWKFNP